MASFSRGFFSLIPEEKPYNVKWALDFKFVTVVNATLRQTSLSKNRSGCLCLVSFHGQDYWLTEISERAFSGDESSCSFLNKVLVFEGNKSAEVQNEAVERLLLSMTVARAAGCLFSFETPEESFSFIFPGFAAQWVFT